MRKITAIVLSLILLVTLTLSVSAAAGTFLKAEYDVISESIYCYGKQLPAGGTLTVSAGSEIVEDATFSTLEKEDIPVTVYCLVDSSTSQPDAMKQQQEDILLTFSSLMSGQDNMVLGLLDVALIEGKPLTEKNARDTAITTIEGQSWYTNLYDGINQAMETLYTSTAYHTNRCLVILSDGHDDGKSTATAEKVLKQIQEAGIPVYTVILSASSMTQTELEYHEQFAEESLGGFVSFPDEEGISASVAAQRIWDSIKGASAVRIGVAQLQNRETDQQLLIRYDAGDTRYEDTVLIRAVDLPVLQEEEPTEATEPVDEKDLPKVVIIGGGVAALLLIGGIVAFALLRKKKTGEDNPDVSDIPEISGSADIPCSDSIFGNDDPSHKIPEPWETTQPVEGRCHVYAVAIMHPEISTDFYLTPKMETTFGRTSKADIILHEGDMKLSGIHGCFLWDGKMLLVRDMGSRNGTAVNGENCHEKVWLRVEEGATLRAGNYEYRINFQTAYHNEL